MNVEIDVACKQLFGTKGNKNILILQKTLSAPLTQVLLENPQEIVGFFL